ncbi:MAG TPA: DNA-3-methyladenine glycosylase [Gemmatimonadales bacterium]|jgi:DNA-3-methyladenine glycosylase
MILELRARPLPLGFFRQDAVTVARELLGKLLVTEIRGVRTVGRIVEVEAYLGVEDPASHAWRFRRHAQNEGLYGPAGNWYVYRSYGVHWCANLVAGPPGQATAVLVRALEPVHGLPAMCRRRATRERRILCAGPGRLTQALGITRALDQTSMPTSSARVLASPPLAAAKIAATPRIGITRATAWPLRFVVRGSPWTSRVRGND